MGDRDVIEGARSPSTVPASFPGLAQERRSRLLRRIALAVLVVLVLAGLLGRLGVRTTTDRAAVGDLEVALVRARVARAALSVPYRLTITRAGGFEDDVEVRITTSYLEALDENGRNPEPDRTATDADETIWWFEPPGGDVLTVWLDTRVDPSVQWRRDGTTTVVSDGDVVVVDHPVWILP